MSWEHRFCGTVYEGRVPPMFCDCCIGGAEVRSREMGWRKVSGALARKHAKERDKASRRRRGKVGRKQRMRIFKRDGFQCITCGSLDRATLTIDHKIPVSKGGSNRDENLQTMCSPCNHQKADTMGAVNQIRWPSEDELRAGGLLP